MAAAAGVAVVEAIEEEYLIDNAIKMGAYAVDKLNQLKEKHQIINHVRGKALMIGIQLTIPGGDIVSKCLENGLRINCTNDTVLRFMPAMNITAEQLDKAIEILDNVLTQGTDG